MSSNTFDLCFQLIRLGLGTNKADENILVGFQSFDDIAWEEIYNLGVRQGVAAIQFDGLQQLYGKAGTLQNKLPNSELKLKWFAHTQKVERHCLSQFKTSAELADIYALHGIRTVVLKGISTGINYPDPKRRPCGDLDCFLMGGYERGNVIAEEHGARVERDFYKHSHISYKGLTVENHQFCTAIRGSKRTKAFERLLQSLLKDEGTTMIDNTKQECPYPMFNALFLTHHAQRHFLSEGIALRHLCDWAMLLHKHGDEIDWEQFQRYCNTYGLTRFADTMTRLANKQLHVDVPALYHVGKDDELDDYLLHEILYGASSLSTDSVWMQRFGIIKNIFIHRKRCQMFSDTSFLQNVFQLIYGFCFDRNPQL